MYLFPSSIRFYNRLVIIFAAQRVWD